MVNGTIKLALEIQHSLSIYFYTTPYSAMDTPAPGIAETAKSWQNAQFRI